jgi:hypothetical protein
MKKAMASHEKANMRTDEWLTPPNIIKSLGEFDLDPCSPIKKPWDTAKNHFNIYDNGLSKEWAGRVWLNPPYGKDMERWMNKMQFHNNGIAFIFARTETEAFFDHVWPKASAIMFLKGRVRFYTVAGKEANMNAGAASVLIAYNNENADALKNSGISGRYINLK